MRAAALAGLRTVAFRRRGAHRRVRSTVATGAVVIGLLLLSLAVGEHVVGIGAANRVAPSNADVVTLDVRPPVLPPGPPTGVVVVAGDRSLTVSWQPPVDDGGAPVLAYEAVSDPRGATCNATPPAATCTIGGLNNGQFFTVSVRAINEAGPGSPSAPSEPVRPRPN
jgi:hypothetical protein